MSKGIFEAFLRQRPGTASAVLLEDPTLKRPNYGDMIGQSAVMQQTRVKLQTIDETEKEHILAVIKHCKGRISGSAGAAEILGVPASTLNFKMKRLGIRKEHISTSLE